MRKVIAAVVLALWAGAAVAATDTTLQATWIAPTTNVDGSQLFDLAGYRMYVSPNVCPVGAFITIPPTTNTPWANLEEAFTITGLVPNTSYTVMVTAVNTAGEESACSLPATASTLPANGTRPPNVINLRITWNPVDRPLQIGDRIISDVNDVHNIRSGPDGNLPPIGQAPPGSTGVITNLAPQYYELRWDNPSIPNGWVFGQWITAQP